MTCHAYTRERSQWHNVAMHRGMPAERARLAAADDGTEPWRDWGPYLAERAWGTVREDYSEWGASWDYLPHDHARSRAYRWNEDGLAGICDDGQRFCFAFALWNGRDPILKERVFGLAGPEGNHGEDAKEYWWYADSTPTHSYLRWRYHYPQAEYPYTALVDASRTAGRDAPEIELADTGVFEGNRYWAVHAEYAKAGPHDMCIELTVTNRGPDVETLHVLPTLWFRNTWSWDNDVADPPVISAEPPRLVARHRELGELVLTGDGAPAAYACDNESNVERLWGYEGGSRYPKDGINDRVVSGADTTNPDGTGSKAALHYVLTVPAGGTARIRLRLNRDRGRADLRRDFDRVLRRRRAEADEYFASLTPAGASADTGLVLRQAVAGLMWSKQFYHYDVARWLAGDPTSEPPPAGHRHGRNTRWTHMYCHDVMPMPDPWEYPWFAAWDLAFHCVAIAHVDSRYAKESLLLLLQERYQHPDGALPAYEWAFDDANPPVHAWAALRVYALDGSRDREFLKRMLDRLLLNFGWWVNRMRLDDTWVFGGGFLGLDNVGPFDRGAIPIEATLAQSDGTAWLAAYALNLMEMALVLAVDEPSYTDLAVTLAARYAEIASAAYEQGLWNEDDGFFFDVLRAPDGERMPVSCRSVVGLLPLFATAALDEATLAAVPGFADRLDELAARRPELAPFLGEPGPDRLLSMVDPGRLVRVLTRMLDETEFLSPYGIRSLSKAHTEPCVVGDFRLGYEPAESRTDTFGGNSNWRGPVWFPVNVVLIDALRRWHRHTGDRLVVEYPTGSGAKYHLGEVADDLSRRLVRLFLRDGEGRRPVFTGHPGFDDPQWSDLPLFYEYFHGDTGAGLGAAHQTGWTALVVDLIRSGRRAPGS